jgi:hypothetical protein
MNSSVPTETSKRLSDLYAANSDLKILVDWLASKQRDTRKLKARVAAYRTEKTELEIREVLKIFRDLGLGTYKTGRKGGETRFEFSVSSRSLQNAAKRGTLVQPIDTKTAEDEEEEEEEDESKKPRSSVLDHTFNLRGDFVVRLKLPDDFSSKEAGRLSAFINSLPLND